MIEPRTLAQRLADARVAELVTAIVATLRPLFPDVDVRELPGRIDISDIIAGTVFAPPMIGVTFSRVRQPIHVGGSYDLPVELVAYIVTEEMAIGGRAERREALAHAIGCGLFEILADLDMPRWGLTSIRLPEEAEMRPLVTSESYAKGVAYYALTWRQVLLGMGTDPLARSPYSGVEAVEDGVVVEYPADLSGAPV
ncbi:hypothetical protein KHC23_08610 [Ancylobacter dichloromethanicus]|uniref:Uncharacterized protein n=1 Tax=Ancylobacter dichloromethanicus TaxID=518825 RepID=A0A9W6JE73_9HYPH|nr:hypothetical protein [Ancylobacter dichloromethanicus]MBS7553710.1 hypothetical protein [Ancylobacter dichloromethanicus]GLK74673.1 hypothetical protein GCM10017643_47920 [Ancylobacter dichloromethanicus]